VIPLEKVPLRHDRFYALIFERWGCVLKPLEDLRIDPSVGLRGLEVALESIGILKIRIHRVSKNAIKEIHGTLTCGGRPPRLVFWEERHGSNPPTSQQPIRIGIRYMQRYGFGPRDGASDDRIYVISERVPPGLWEIDLEIRNRDWKGTVALPPGETIEVDIDRDDLSNSYSVVGTLKYSSGLPLDGADFCFILRTHSNELEHIPPGRYRLVLTALGFNDKPYYGYRYFEIYESSVAIAANEITELNVVLTPR